MPLRTVQTLVSRIFLQSYYSKWTDQHSLEAWWEPRTRKIAEFVPKHTKVIEFGSGSRWLESYLDPTCEYVPSDLIDRGPGTVICDLNKRPLPDLKPIDLDVAVFIGVLEYVCDLPSVIEWLAKHVSVCVMSYVCASTDVYTIRGLNEALQRLKAGYMNNYREEELLALFHERGFVCVCDDTWENNRLFLLHSKDGKGKSTP